MGALTDELRAFLDREPVGVLATVAADGSPRQSLVYFARDGNQLLISTLADRLKSRDVPRTGAASQAAPSPWRPTPAMIASSIFFMAARCC